MQRNFSTNMADSLNSNSGSPEEKLRKISFHTSDLEEYLNSMPNFQSQKVEGWGNQTWRVNDTSFYTNKKQLKPVGDSKNSKNSSPLKKSPMQRNRLSDRKQYIQKLEEKLIQLVNEKKERKKTAPTDQPANIQLLTPRKSTNVAQRTTSTSESDYEKYEHNFTNTSMRKLIDKGSLFKVRRHSKQFYPDTNLIKIKEPLGQTKTYIRPSFNRSMLTSYEHMSQKSKEISIISYPVLESERKPRHRKLSKLQDFKESFYIKHNPELFQKPLTQSKLLKQENSLFKIKISQPKISQSKSLKVKY